MKSECSPLTSGVRIADIRIRQRIGAGTTGAALLENNEATAKSTSQDGGMAVNFG